MGSRGQIYNLIESYLKNRRQKVQIETYYSKEEIVVSGVPQGIVLGPLLFNLYLADLFNLTTTSSNVINYADDTVNICSGNNFEDLKKFVELEFKYIQNWLY